MALLVTPPPCVLFEDDHLLVVHKPSGLNTHAPSPYAGEGLYEWLKHREPRWASLAIVHRLDKGTSGLMVFARSPEANRSLTSQFATRRVRKAYRFLTHRFRPEKTLEVRGSIVRVGEKYFARPEGSPSDFAETHFRSLGPSGPFLEWEAAPLTGRTHQIRVHAQSLRLPILGDELYEGAAYPRMCLHAAQLAFDHPVTGAPLEFSCPADFQVEPALRLRSLLIDPAETDAFRLLHGASDGAAGCYLDRFGPTLLAETTEAEVTVEQRRRLEDALRLLGVDSCFHKLLDAQVRRSKVGEASPRRLSGTGTSTFPVRENGVRYEISFEQGYSVGLFLDQRDNRRRLLQNHVAAGFPLFADGLAGREVLNTFAYTCAFSVCAALAGAHTTSLDLSRKYLEWGRRNFSLNQLALAGHDFVQGDVFDWARRFQKKGRLFDVILLDPPTFSQSAESGIFQAEKHYGKLVGAVLPLLRPEGILFCSTNAQRIEPEQWISQIEQTLAHARRRPRQKHYAPQPVDFPISKTEPAYLKTAWFRVG